MVTRLLLILAITAAQFVSAAETTELTGREIEAVSVAVAAFKRGRYSASGDLRHFTVELDRHGKQLEVTFVPNIPPLRPNEGGTGGGNIYGSEVHYYVALDTLKIVRMHFAR